MNASRDDAQNDCELNFFDGIHCNGFYRLTRKGKKKDLIAKLLILCEIRCHSI